MKRLLPWLACFVLALPASWAADLKPPVPVDNGDGLDILPPPLDLDQMTPVSLPNTPTASQTVQTQSMLKALDDAQPTPSMTPEKIQAATPTQTALTLAATATPAPEAPKMESAQAAPLGALSGYFPAAKGHKWSYEFLKQAPGEASKKTMAVECVEAEPSDDGSVTATFQVTENGKNVQEKYTIFAGKVAHNATDAQALADELVYQLPAKGAVARWTAGGNYYKAVFGAGQVYQKTYPDCIIVTEKTKSSTILSYYAKGVGLVAVEVYGKGMKLDPSKSIALVSADGEPSK